MLIDRVKELPHFAANLLTITQKLSGMSKLNFKPLQHRILVKFREQLQAQNEIRYVIVKPRQIMSSTVCESLAYEEMNAVDATQCMTITNKGSVTDELFRTVKRFHDYFPEDLKLKAKKDNEEILYLSNESLMKVATAGSDGARGFPCRILIASEVGRYTGKQAADYTEGALQTLAKGQDSVGIEESTSGGSGNYFHEKALGGWDERTQSTNKSERWRTMFFGWHEFAEYALEPPKYWEPNDDEKTLADEFKLSWAQLYWRYDKLKNEFRGSTSSFSREYPINFDSAFEDAAGRLIDPLAIHLARKNDTPPSSMAPAIMGVDPAGGGDRTVILIRQGHVVVKYWTEHSKNDSLTIQKINSLLNEYPIQTCFIDMGYGHTMVSALRDLGRTNVIGVHAGSTSTLMRPDLYQNKRAEMAAAVKDWLEEGPDDRGGIANIPDDDEFAADLKAIPELMYSGRNSKFYLPSKEEIKKGLGGKSTDIFDALGFTFALPVKNNSAFQLIHRPTNQETRQILQTSRDFAELQDGKQQDTINPNFRYFTHGPKPKEQNQW